MAQERNALKAGTFILFTIALIVTGIVLIAGPDWFTPKRLYQAKFPLNVDLAGLRAGDDVRLGGSKLGSVVDIEVVTPEAGEPYTIVKFNMPTRIRLKTDAQVSVSASFTGLAQLNIPVVGLGADATDKDLLVGRGGGLNAVIETVQRLTPKVEETVDTVQTAISDIKSNTIPKVNSTLDAYKQVGDSGVELVAHVRSKVDPAVERYNNIAIQAERAAKNAGDLLGDGNDGQVKTTMNDVKAMVAELKTKVPALVDRISGLTEKVAGTLDRASDTLEKFKETAENARVATNNVREIIARNATRIDAIINSTRTSAENIRLATSEIRRSPWRLLYKPSKEEMLNQDLFNAAREFAEGASRLADTVDTLKGLKDSGTATDAEIQSMLNALNEAFEQFKNVEKRLYDEVK